MKLVSLTDLDAISAEVVVVEPTGSVPEGVLRKGHPDLNITSPERLNLRAGEIVHLTAGRNTIQVFEHNLSDQPHLDAPY